MGHHRAAHLTLALALMAGCNSYAGPAEATLEALVPEGLAVHATHRATFRIDGREVALTHVEYGQLMDCPSGCFASHVCAIEDGADVFLFYASWTGEDEAPLGVAEACPGLERSETWPDCEPPGLAHPVTATPEFAAFAQAQIGSGPLRWCLNRYGARFGSAGE